jgi:adenosylhomocysteinase
LDCDVKDLNLASQGKLRIEWAENEMPVLRLIRERFQKEKPLSGVSIAACMHVTTETANLMRTLIAGGAEAALCASNPLSTQDDAAASMVSDFGTSVYAVKGEDRDTYYAHLNRVLDHKPQITMDDGADTISVVHSARQDLAGRIYGGTEETTTGVIRLRSMEKQNVLLYPIIAVNDADTKHLFDNRYGTGQSTVDAIMRTTNFLMAGRTFVVAGYGMCGRGVAMRAKGLGANVIITEVDPLRALEARMDGYTVLPMKEAAAVGEVFCTVTGDIRVLGREHFEAMRDGAIICNSGHFDVEIDIPALAEMSVAKRTIRPFVEEYSLSDGKRIILLAEGRLVNLSAAEGHPASVMDMSFANQALCAEYLTLNHADLGRQVYTVPPEIDREVARLKLKAMGITIDTLTAEQEEYLSSWRLGT